MPTATNRFRLSRLGALVLGIASACGAGQHVWIDDYKPPASNTPTAYVIASGDLISVRVFNQDQMSARERVRPDGKVSLPFLGDVLVAGYSPQTLGAQLQTRLKDFINNPVVTVAVDEPRGVPVSVAGEVSKPGLYTMEAGSGVLQALLAAGGLTDFAGRDRIFVLRPSGSENAPIRLRFRYWALVRGEGAAPLFKLSPGDTVVAE
ncbi:MAG: polysaccharide biosynthesis/export family protein [Myxococcaceae bacterium]